MSELATFIPAGGLGSRLHPHTLRLPKPLLTMGSPDMHIIDFPIAVSAAASEQVWVSTDYQGLQIEEYLQDTPNVHLLRDDETIGSGGSLIKHYNLISNADSEGDTLILPSDHIYDGLSILDFWEKHQSENADITLLTVPPKPYGEYVALTNDIPSSVKKHALQDTPSTTGIFILRNQFLMNWINAARRNSDSPINCNIYHDIICPSVGRSAVSHYFLDYPGYWEDAGTPPRYLASNMRLSGGETVIAATASIASPERLDGCVVLPDTVIEKEFHASNAIISGTYDGKLLVTKIL